MTSVFKLIGDSRWGETCECSLQYSLLLRLLDLLNKMLIINGVIHEHDDILLMVIYFYPRTELAEGATLIVVTLFIS